MMVCVPCGASVTMRLETSMPAKTKQESGLQTWKSEADRASLIIVSFHLPSYDPLTLNHHVFKSLRAGNFYLDSEPHLLFPRLRYPLARQLS
ncbi:hypothetical protein BJV78DRAFT_375670 [Lactifluus subvellereus]|nr:hypothetical protein BJV78DRAFT_375670 [Lactifluus subvellereus]